MTDEELAEALVNTSPFCSRSIMVAPAGVVVPEEVVACALVKVTVPKSAKGTKEEPSSKSSTIHSAFSWQRWAEEVRALETVWPRLTLVIVAVPEVVEEAATVTVTVSPASMVMPVKSVAKAGKYSNQAMWKIDNNETKKRVKKCSSKRRTIIGDTATRNGEVETGLQDSSSASVTVDTDPSRGGESARASTRGNTRSGNDEGSGHALEGVLQPTSK